MENNQSEGTEKMNYSDYVTFFSAHEHSKSDRKSLFIESGKIFAEKMAHMYDLIMGALDTTPYDPASNKLRDKSLIAPKSSELKSFYYINELNKAWELLGEYCDSPDLQPILPWVIFTCLCNSPDDNIVKILKKAELSEPDKEKIISAFFIPHEVRKLKPSKDVEQWNQTKTKIYEHFYIIMGFYIILSLPLCKGSDIKLCLKCADSELPVLLDVFTEAEKPVVLKAFSESVLEIVGLNGDLSLFKAQKDDIDRNLEKIIDSTDFDDTWESFIIKIRPYYKEAYKYQNTLALRLTIFEGKSIDKVIAPTDHAYFFFRLFDIKYYADRIIIEDRYDIWLLNENDPCLDLYWDSFTGNRCDYLNNREIPCHITTCESRNSCPNGIPPINAICIDNVSFEIIHLGRKMPEEDTLKENIFGFDSDFLFADSDTEHEKSDSEHETSDCEHETSDSEHETSDSEHETSDIKYVIYDNAAVNVSSGEILLFPQSETGVNKITIESGTFSGSRIILYNPKIISHNMIKKNKNIKKIVRALLGLSLSTIKHIETYNACSYSDPTTNALANKVRGFELENNEQ